jgi:peptidyl-dipeptidase Dcp
MSLTNPLLQEWSGPYGGVPPWDRVVVSDFPEAFEAALADQRASLERIASNPEPPTFETISDMGGLPGQHQARSQTQTRSPNRQSLNSR